MNPNYQTSSKIQDFVRNHRALSLIILATTSILLILGIFLIINYFFQTRKEPEPEIAPYPYFENRDLIKDPIGRELANYVFTDIGNIIVNKNEIASAPSENQSDPYYSYTVTFDENSFRDISSIQGIGYKVNLKISDGREYVLYIFLDYTMANFLAIAFDRIDSDTISDNAFVYSTNEKAKNNAIKLINNLNLSTSTITEKPLELD